MGEGRIDITNSEISYLGYDGSESWGLSWKVRRFCVEKTNLEQFGSVGVFGNIYDSDIHHNYYGQYSYGHRGGDWSNNTVHDNVRYGFDYAGSTVLLPEPIEITWVLDANSKYEIFSKEHLIQLMHEGRYIAHKSRCCTD